MNLEIRLADLVARTRDDGGCMVWTGHAGQGKYPQWRIGSKCYPVHRLVWLLSRGPIRKGLQISAGCSCQLCVHPDHLVARTRAETMKGKPKPLLTRQHIAQSRRKGSKLSMEIVREVRASAEPGTVIEARLGLKPGYASRIRLGKVWAEPSPFVGLGARPDSSRARAFGGDE